MTADRDQARLERALVSLDGLSVGDAFGETFFHVDSDDYDSVLHDRRLSPATWPFTDDTQMALSIVSILRQYGAIDQDHLAASFAERYDFGRGYGPSMHQVLRRIGEGQPWREVAG